MPEDQVRADLGLQTHEDAIHLIAFVRGERAAATHCGLLLPVRAEDLSGSDTCVECFARWIETPDAVDRIGAAAAPVAASPPPA